MSTEFEVRPPGTPRYLKPLAIAGAIAALAVAAAGLVARTHDAHAVAAWTVQQAIPTVATVARSRPRPTRWCCPAGSTRTSTRRSTRACPATSTRGTPTSARM